jgi:peptide/nickel transport system substrate-binding protein
MKGFKVLLLLLAAPFISLESGVASAENVLRWASPGGAATFDPHAFDESATFAQLAQVYEGLVGLDSNLALVPRLATTWRLVDPTTWEFKLRPNVRFHDGTPLTAEDVVFSLARAKTELVPAVGVAHNLESVAETIAVDPHTVRVVTVYPNPGFPSQLASIYVMSARWAEEHDARVPANVSAGEETFASRHANGTGAFILKEFEPNGPLVMVRNRDWWGFERYPHNLDRIEYRPIAAADERLAMLLDGRLDLVTTPPLAALDRIRSTPGLKLAQATELRTAFLALDQASPELRSSDVRGENPFSDKRVRQAIYHGIDIEAIVAEVMQGLAVPAAMLVTPGVNGYAPELDQRLAHDPKVAKALLTAAGYPDGFSVTLDCPKGSSAVNDEVICRAIAAQLGEIGIDMLVNAGPKDVIYAKIDNRESDFYLDSWGTLDSQEVFVNLYRTNAGLNGARYSNPRVDALIEQIDREMITYGRDALIEEVWKAVLDDIAYIPLHHQVVVWAMRDHLDLPVYPRNIPLFREARLRPAKVN